MASEKPVIVTNDLPHVLFLPPVVRRKLAKDGTKMRDEVGRLVGPIIAKCDAFRLDPGDNDVPKATWELAKEMKVVKNYLAAKKGITIKESAAPSRRTATTAANE